MFTFQNQILTEEQPHVNVEESYSSNLLQPETLGEEYSFLRKQSQVKSFRFLFLIIDVVALNFIPLILLHFMNRVEYSLAYFILFISINFFWIVSAYINALYFAADRFVKRSVYTFSMFFTTMLLFVFLYNFDYSRLFILLNFAGVALSLICSRSLFVGTNYFIKSGRRFVKKVVVLGIGNVSEKLTVSLKSEKDNFEIHGYFDDSRMVGINSSEYPVLGSIRDSIKYAINNGIDEVYSTIMPDQNPFVYDLALEAERNFIRFKFVPDFSTFVNRKLHVNFLLDTPIFSLRPEPLQELSNQMKKRVFDIVFSVLVITLLLSWLIPLIAILIKLDSRGPVFFRQFRSGKNNRKFSCFKFRSLHVNSEADTKQVGRNDSRFTRLGKILRKTNLDELPQFFNVLRGDISVVGPRPHMVKHTEEYSAILNKYMVRHFIKPGITGLAQINGFRGEIKRKEQLHKRIEYDILYMENWSMWLDLKIILLTIYVTFKGDKNAF